MYDNVKEIHVGVVESRDRNGDKRAGAIWLRGRPVPAGTYDRDHLPPKWTWEMLCAKALQHDGYGIKVVYMSKLRKQEVISSG